MDINIKQVKECFEEFLRYMYGEELQGIEITEINEEHGDPLPHHSGIISGWICEAWVSLREELVSLPFGTEFKVKGTVSGEGGELRVINFRREGA
jgi:hypothetical protein